MRFFVFLSFLFFFYFFVSVISQQEILSISSFQACVDVDTRLGQPNYNQNITNINCGPPGQTQPPITVLNLLFSPNVGSEASFEFNLTVVSGASNVFQNTTSTIPNRCQLSNNNLELCTLTTPATIKIQSSRLAYKYRLSLNTNNLIPYCYASTSLFEQYQGVTNVCDGFKIQSSCKITDGQYDCSGSEADACIPIQNTKDATAAMLKTKINQMAGSGLTDQFKLSSFERVQTPFFPFGVLCGNSGTTTDNDVFWNTIPSSLIGSGNSNDFSWVMQRQGNLLGFFDPLNQSSIYNFGPFVPNSSPNYCRLYQNSLEQDLYYDSPNLDIRIPSIYPQPSIFGFTPSPIYRNLVTDPINGDPSLIIPPTSITNFNFITGSVSFSCAGFSCAANKDERKLIGIDPNADISSSYATTVHSIVGLGPYCAVYDINAIPEVFAEIVIDVSINTPSGIQTETITIDNFNPSTSSRSNPQGFVFGKIESIFSANNVIGPAIQGKMIVCGQQYEQLVNGIPNQNPSQNFPNMQCLIPGVVCDDTQSVILDQSPNFSEVDNPWPTIIEQSQTQPGMEKRTNFFPHPFDYIVPNAETNKKNIDFTSLPNDKGQTFWYFVDSTTYANQFGKQCNEIGLAVGGNSLQQNSNLWCNIDPHECLPGLGTTVNGGLKNALPCIVSQYMNLASGIYNGTNFPFPYGTKGLSDSDASLYNFDSSVFLNWMLNNATNFVPTNPFISSKSTFPLYDPKNPQFWLGREGGNGNAFLYYSPTVTENNITQSLSSIGINLVLDVAGNFVEYTVSVAQGEIDIPNSKCSVIQGEVGGISIAVKNPSNPGLSTTTTYTVFPDCNPPPPNSNNIPLNVIPQTQDVTLAPGEEALLNFSITSGNGEPVNNNINCQITLSYAELATAISDVQILNCAYQLSFIPPEFQSGLPTPPNTPPAKYSNTTGCHGFCALPCRVALGVPQEDGCFWISIIFLTAVVGLFIASIAELISLRVKLNGMKYESQKQSESYLKEEIEKE